MRRGIGLVLVMSAAMALSSCGGGSTTRVQETTTTAAVFSVPKVTGKQERDAESTLRRVRGEFRVDPLLQVPNAARPGTVLAQHPSAGSPAAKGSAVTLTVSAAPQLTAPGPPAPTGTRCGGTVRATGVPRRARNISASGVSCSAALIEVSAAHRLLGSCAKGDHCKVGDYSCTQTYYGGPTMSVLCVRGQHLVRWEWGGYG